MNGSLIRWLGVLALLGSVLPSCAANSGAGLDPTARTSAADGPEQRIASLVHDWFGVLEGERPRDGEVARGDG